jgi:hypothetical protein
MSVQSDIDVVSSNTKVKPKQRPETLQLGPLTTRSAPALEYGTQPFHVDLSWT